MSRTKIAEYQGPCSDLFLRINSDYSKEIPSEDETLKTIAYIEIPTLPPKYDRPPDPPNPGDNPKPYGGFYFILIAPNGDGTSRNLVTGLTWTGSGGIRPRGAISGSFTGFEFVPWINGYGRTLYIFKIKFLNELGTEITDYTTTFWSSVLEPFPVQVLQWPIPTPPTTPSGDPPPEPPEPPGPRQGSPRLLIETETEIETTSTTIEDPFTETVKKAWFHCENCEPNCILMTRQKGGKYAEGLCICKDNKEDLEPMKDKIKAELLAELPPIVQTRMKAQDFGPLKKELKEDIPPIVRKVQKEDIPETLDSDVYIKKYVGIDTVDKDGKPVIAPPKPLTTLVSNIKDALLKNPEFLEAPSLIKAIETVIQEQVPEVKDSIEYGKHIGVLDDKGKEIKIPDPENPKAPPTPAIPTITNVVSNIKNLLAKDEEFLNALWSDIESRLLTQEFKISLFTGDEIATILADSLNDDAKIAALKTKLGIATPQADPNKLMANGYEWTIAKDTAGAVVSVSRTTKAGDNLSLLTNSGSAIVTALVAKFPGKSFAVTSSTQNAGTYFYSIDQN